MGELRKKHTETVKQFRELELKPLDDKTEHVKKTKKLQE